MSILSTELKAYRAAQHDDNPTNGGVLTNTQLVSGVKNNVWPDAPQAELDAGSIKYRKVFLKVDTAENIDLNNGLVYIENYTPGDDRVLIFPGTPTDIQSEVSGAAPDLYGCGKLDADVIASATTVTVLLEDPTDIIFREGDLIRISDKTDINDSGGSAELATISGTPSVNAGIATITLVAGLSLPYTAALSRVSSVIDAGIVGTSYTTPIYTNTGGGSGTMDNAGNPIVLESIGGVDDDWTLTFTSSTNFTITRVNTNVGDGALTGTVGGVSAPVNSDTGSAYFTIPSAFFGGSFLQNDIIEFSTVSASTQVWEKRIIPDTAGSLTANSVKLVLQGESSE